MAIGPSAYTHLKNPVYTALHLECGSPSLSSQIRVPVGWFRWTRGRGEAACQLPYMRMVLPGSRRPWFEKRAKHRQVQVSHSGQKPECLAVKRLTPHPIRIGNIRVTFGAPDLVPNRLLPSTLECACISKRTTKCQIENAYNIAGFHNLSHLHQRNRGNTSKPCYRNRYENRLPPCNRARSPVQALMSHLRLEQPDGSSSYRHSLPPSLMADATRLSISSSRNRLITAFGISKGGGSHGRTTSCVPGRTNSANCRALKSRTA